MINVLIKKKARIFVPSLSCHTIEPLFITKIQRDKEQEGERDKARVREKVTNNKLRGMKENKNASSFCVSKEKPQVQLDSLSPLPAR